MTPVQAEQFRYNVLDLTKVWPHEQYPLREIGKFVLNKNVENYFADVEQVGFLLILWDDLSNQYLRLRFLPLILFPTLSLLPTLSCSLAFSPTRTLTATALESITINSLSTNLKVRL